MQPVNSGGPIVGCHDGGEDALSLGDGAWSWIRYFDVLSPEDRGLLVEAGLGFVAYTLLLAAWARCLPSFERVLEMGAERALLVSELVDEVTSVAPEREVRIGLGGVEGRAGALLVVVVQQVGRVAAPLACRGREGVERDVGGPPGVRVGRNLEGWRLVGAA